MTCHETEKEVCIGWLVNQLNEGNNIKLRIRMLEYDLSEVETFGKQCESFKETLKD